MGVAFDFEARSSYRSTQKVRILDTFGMIIKKNIEDYSLTKRCEMFGTRVAAEIGMHSILNSGLFGMAGKILAAKRGDSIGARRFAIRRAFRWR